MIVSPMSRIIAGPMGPEEGILYADCDLEQGIQMKLRHDFAGHYNRPDIFHLEINRAAPRLYTEAGTPSQAAIGSGEAKPVAVTEPHEPKRLSGPDSEVPQVGSRLALNRTYD